MAPLGQIGKRLQIIKTAISLTDAEVIAMQCSRLRVHKKDKQLNNILSVLDSENYVQAGKLIDRYLHGPYDDRSEEDLATEEEHPAETSDETEPIEEKREHSKEEAELIKRFGLFEEAERERYNPIDEEEMFKISAAHRNAERSSEESKETLPPKQQDAEEIIAAFDTIEKDKLPLSDRMKSRPRKKSARAEKREKTADPEKTPVEKVEKIDSRKDPETRSTHKKEEPPKERLDQDSVEDETGEPRETESRRSASSDLTYAPISYIDQKLRNMRNQYPQVEESSERFESEEKLLYMISLEGYSEADIEEAIEKVFALKQEGKVAEAAHLLLISAATESLYAQFILARELYKGDILQKDLPEAFTQINRLALIDYPEAVCDLAQFYEYGIGIDKDKKRAFALYEDALELGVQRAETHLSRMEEASRGLLGKLFRR